MCWGLLQSLGMKWKDQANRIPVFVKLMPLRGDRRESDVKSAIKTAIWRRQRLLGGCCSRYLAWEDLPAEVTLSWDLNEVLQPWGDTVAARPVLRVQQASMPQGGMGGHARVGIRGWHEVNKGKRSRKWTCRSNKGRTSLVVQWLRLRLNQQGGVYLIPDQGAKMLHALSPKNQNRSNIVTNSIKTLKMVRNNNNKILKKKIFGKKKRTRAPTALSMLVKR